MVRSVCTHDRRHPLEERFSFDSRDLWAEDFFLEFCSDELRLLIRCWNCFRVPAGVKYELSLSSFPLTVGPVNIIFAKQPTPFFTFTKFGQKDNQFLRAHLCKVSDTVRKFFGNFDLPQGRPLGGKVLGLGD